MGFRKKKKELTLDELKKDIQMTEHLVSLEELCKMLGTDCEKGLTTSRANDLQRRYGKNALTPPHRTPKIVLLLKSLFGGFNWLLWAGSVASLVSYLIESSEDENASKDNLYLAIVLASVVTITGVFAFYQEMKSSAIMQKFSEMVPPSTRVMRDGAFKEMKSVDVVPGDVVEVRGGDRIPADIRIIKANGLKVDCSSLTGESEPQSRSDKCTSKNPLETENLALFGTNAVEGQCIGVIILIGDRTVMGRIAALTSKVVSGKTPLAKEIDHFINIIGAVAVVIGVTFFIVSLAFNYAWLEALVFLIGIIVANVPEGIVATVTVCLTLTAVKMKKKNCLVKKLEGVETLGSTSTICSDKTGTLTQNRMTVTHAWVDGEIIAIEPTAFGAAPKPKLDLNAFAGSKGLLLRCASLCSNAQFKNENSGTPIETREAIGNASEVAILRYCERISGDTVAYRQLYPKVCEIPFNSSSKYQISIHLSPDGKYIIVMKGAPEVILLHCATISNQNVENALFPETISSFQKAYEFMGGQGERVLGFCDLELDPQQFPKGFNFDSNNINFPVYGLRFLGLIAMIDPPRPGVPNAVRLCQTAGIKIVMVTGDHPLTASAIATQVHIFAPNCTVTQLVTEKDVLPDFNEESEAVRSEKERNRAIIIHGERLRNIKEGNLEKIARYFGQIVFARTSPNQKLQIVEAFQKAGCIVAVTGDGVNDAPALRKADIGIAMGIAGTDVSKEAADMILLDDNFASIVTGVEEGRIIFDNLKKSIAYTLTSNIPEIAPFLTFVVFGIPLPMSVVAILCIDLGTDLWPAISIAYEEAESDIMKRRPRDPFRDRLVNARLLNFSYLQIGVMQAAAGFCTYFFIMGHHGFLPNRLLWIRSEWDNKYLNDVEDSFGQQWTYNARKDLEHCCHGAFFFAIVVVQWADLLISKTRFNSIVSQGMSNHVLNTGLIFTTVLATALLFTPGLNEVFRLTPIRLEHAMISVPFALLIFLYDEIRKYICRNWPNGNVYRETYY